MRLTMTDKTEIKQIIASFNEDDNAAIDKQVEMLCANMRPVLNMLESHKPDDYTKHAVEWLGEDDCNYQDMAGTVMWDLFRPRVEVEYAMSIFMRRHIFEDAA
ncbi:hypothetical protein B9Q31_02220 [Enterobacter kobei]|uniref:hypothetical protein n=1 Tax=Enterobacter kobei TaxID=208224 RepID=UPI000C1F24CC|nr:hypothetical protein [Enterobacter kobei]MBT1798806.1 hypothetical protein [Enterobacter kobei]MBW7698072.1 hypothetical protein [Enterobacter kobei]MBW7774416.1 hypothetical protein [Enterobacter kobei]PJD62117.1 hypothetical protein B9Q31_02220 [Enterobacter kobei]